MNSFGVNGTALNSGSFYIAHGDLSFQATAVEGIRPIACRQAVVDLAGRSQVIVNSWRNRKSHLRIDQEVWIHMQVVAYRSTTALFSERANFSCHQTLIRGGVINSTAKSYGAIWTSKVSGSRVDLNSASSIAYKSKVRYKGVIGIPATSTSQSTALVYRPAAFDTATYSHFEMNGSRNRVAIWMKSASSEFYIDAVSNPDTLCAVSRHMRVELGYRTFIVPVQYRAMKVT